MNIIRKCSNCGREFGRADVAEGRWRGRRGASKDFCSALCDFEWSDVRVKALMAEGKPIVTVDDHGVTCNICGCQFTAIGGHLQQKHGFPVIPSREDRQSALGIPPGSRLASKSAREDMRSKAQDRIARNGVPEQAIEMLKGKLGAFARHVKACVTRKCEQCDRSFTINQSRPKRFCSRKCAADSHVGVAMVFTPEARKRKSESARAYRLSLRKNGTCKCCRSVFHLRKAKQEFCSVSCALKQRHRENRGGSKPAAFECGDFDFVASTNQLTALLLDDPGFEVRLG